jgi:hypothetical protein
MRFSISSVSSAKRAPSRGREEQFLCVGLLLVIGGWIASHPPPKAPTLPSACKARLQKVLPAPKEDGPAKMPPVWVDTRTGVFYFHFDKRYGGTTGGRYLEMEAARAQGYRSSARQ